MLIILPLILNPQTITCTFRCHTECLILSAINTLLAFCLHQPGETSLSQSLFPYEDPLHSL